MKTSLSRLPVSRGRASSTSRPSGSTSALINTPSTLRRSKSSLSLKRTPQSAHVRSRSAERSRAKKKDVRPIQDKKWQANMLERTQYYFQQCPDAIPFLNKGNSIRPITLNMFVQLANIVLQNIDSNFDNLTLANYTELLPIHLNLLMYPGNVSASMLKTANTMHSWPHILAILSWLVELHELIINTDIENILFDLPPNAPLEAQIIKQQAELKIDFFIKWNKGNEIENQVEIFENMYRKFYNFSEDTETELDFKLQKIKDELNSKEEELAKEKQQLMDYKNNEITLLKQIDELKKTIKNQKETKHEIEMKKSDFMLENNSLRNKINEINISIEQIKETLKNQTVNVDQIQHEIQKIDELNIQKNLLEEKKKHQHLLRDEKDIELSEIKRKIELEVNNYNIELMRPALTHPELNEIALRQERLIQPDMIELVQEKIKNKEFLTNDLNKKIHDMKDELINIKEKCEIKQKDLEILQTKGKNENLILEERKLKYAELLQTSDETLNMKKIIIENLKQKILEINESNPSIEDQTIELNTLTTKLHNLETSFKDKQDEMLIFFKNLQEEIIKQDDRYGKLVDSWQEMLDKFKEQYTKPPASIMDLLDVKD